MGIGEDAVDKSIQWIGAGIAEVAEWMRPLLQLRL